MPVPRAGRDLPRIFLGVLLLGALIAGTLWILRPFLPALVWATMIVVATWPVLLAIQRSVGGRRGLATAVMMLLLLIIVIAPLAAAVSTIVEQSSRLADIRVAEIRIPSPPAWVAGLPLVGARIDAEWQALASATQDSLVARATPYVRPVFTWIAGQAGSLGVFVLHLLLTLGLCGVLYATGETAARGVRRFARRVHGAEGEGLVVLAAGSIRAVALGIVVTAVVQTTLGALGLVAASVPYVAIFAAVMFVFCIAQIGPTLPMLAGVGWLYYTGGTTAATLLLVWTLVVGSIDNVLRPILIRRGADLPLLLIMAGVIGGLIGFGLVGLFVGPVVLAIAYKVIGAWIDEQDAGELGAPSRPQPGED